SRFTEAAGSSSRTFAPERRHRRIIESSLRRHIRRGRLTIDPISRTMRPHLAAVAAVLLVSSALSAQPAQRVSQRLALNDDEECVAVSAPLLSRAAAGRDRTSFSLDLLAQFDDSAAARRLP